MQDALALMAGYEAKAGPPALMVDFLAQAKQFDPIVV
jgi:hypothetical protein